MALTPSTSRFVAYILSLVFGLFQALRCFPFQLIKGQVPASIQESHGDFLQHIIGQIYFLHQHWHWPLLLDQRLGAPPGTSIAMTDSIPLEALILRLVHPLFPHLTQGITLYLTLCWTLQPVCAVFALRSLGEKRLFPALAVAVFSSCFPTFLFRLGHAALCGHWILLLAIGLYFRATQPGASRRPVWLLAFLTTATLLVHPYLMVMTGAILGAVPLTLILRDRNWKNCSTTLLATVVSGLSIIVLGSVLGYWKGVSGGGYGFYSMNLAAPFWPEKSSIFPAFSENQADATGGQTEGYQYLGLGLLLLLPAVLLNRKGISLFARLPGQHPGLLLACLALTAIAVSNRVYFLHFQVLFTHFRVPGAEQMRASGRMFWPVAYLIMLGAVYGLCRVWPRTWPVILLFAVALQWGDTYGMRQSNHAAELALIAPATHSDEELLTLLRPFNRIEIHPRLECDGTDLNDVMPLIYGAALQNAWINTIYAARMAPEAACQTSTEQPHPLPPQTLVILTGASRQVQAHRWAKLQHARCGARDKAVFCVSADTELPVGLSPVRVETPILPVDQDILTADKKLETEEILESGWSDPESWGVWSRTPDPSLYLHLPPDVHEADIVLRLRAAPGTTQHVSVFLNGTRITNWDVQPSDADYEARFTLPPNTVATSLHLQISNPVHIGPDPRLLGIGLIRFRVHRLG